MAWQLKLNTDELARDFIDVFLTEIQHGTSENFDLEALELTLLDLFKAGAETSSTTILWVVLYLVKYQGSNKPYEKISTFPF